MIADIISNKKLNQIVTDVFTGGRKPKNFYCFYRTILFPSTKNVKLNCRHFLALTSQTTKSFDKSHLIIHEILTLKTL